MVVETDLLKNAFNKNKCKDRCDLSTCNGVAGAKSLDLSGCGLTDIPRSLKKFRSLDALDLSNNDISTIDNLDDLKGLKYINLGLNEISKIEGLTNLRNLRTLRLRGNSIKKMEGLDTLITLENLDLRGNEIEWIEGLGNLDNLKRLELKRNPLKSEDDQMLIEVGFEFSEKGIRLRREEIARNAVFISADRKSLIGKMAEDFKRYLINTRGKI